MPALIFPLREAAVIGPGEFAALVAMVVLTTVLTPPLLRWRLGRQPAGAREAA